MSMSECLKAEQVSPGEVSLSHTVPHEIKLKMGLKELLTKYVCYI